MVHTRNQQADAARSAIASLLKQDWPHLEVVVYNATSHPLFRLSVGRVLEIHLRPDHPALMLEIAANNCNGEWCLLACPDCWYYPSYAAEHMTMAKKPRLTLAETKYVYGLRDQKLILTSDPGVPSACFYRFRRVKFNLPLEPQFEETTLVARNKPLLVKFAREIVNPTATTG